MKRTSNNIKAGVTGVCLAAFLATSIMAGAITVGPGPWIGTDKRGVAWYEEFQDWNKFDLRALDTNGDNYMFGDDLDMSRDLVAVYSRDEGDTYFFRVDFFDMAFGAEQGSLNVYVAVDCAPGGAEWLPDDVDTKTSNPWEICVGAYGPGSGNVYNSSYEVLGWAWKGAYWRSDLDSVEFGISRFALTDMGWDGSSPLNIQVYTTREGTSGGAGETGGSDIVDTFGYIERDSGNGSGYLSGAISTANVAGRAKYAAVAHANQSVATKGGTQTHIFNNRGDINLYPGFVRTLDSAEMFHVPMNLHISGTLLMSFMWARQDPNQPGYPERDGPTFVERVRNFVKGGPGSIIGGVLAEHIMPCFEGEVNTKSIQQNSVLLDHLFGLSEQDMKVMHTPERVIRSNTGHPSVSPDGPLDGKTFEDIESSGFVATYLDEVTHLHHWFYPNEQWNPGWDDYSWGRWAGGQGNDEEWYQHKVHKINGVYTMIINDREDQSKFGNDDGGMLRDTRYTLLQKALSPDYAQLTLVFDDWEAFAGNSFASSTPNGNADQWHNTLRWAANHQWIEMVNLKDVAEWAMNDPAWVVDHGYVYDKSTQTYEWLKHAAEGSYDTWYYGSGLEESFYHRKASVIDGWAPDGMKKYGDMNSTGTLIRDSWDTIQQISSPNLKKLSEWSYSAMIYETAWHDENPPGWWPPSDKPWLAWADAYQSRNYQATFDRPEANSYADDWPLDWTAGWAIRLHGHVRDMGVMKDASDWVNDIKSGVQGAATWAYAKDVDDDTLHEYVLRNDKVFLCFERWGARLIKAFVFDPSLNGGDAREVVGVPISNPPQESENEQADNNRCSVFKDRYSTGQGGHHYVDMDFAGSSAPYQGPGFWSFTSHDGRVTKKITLLDGKDAAVAEYSISSDAGTIFSRHGLGPNQMDLMLNGHANLSRIVGNGYRGLKNSQGGEVYVVAVENTEFVDGAIQNAGWEHREMPLIEQFETFNTAQNAKIGIAFSQATAQELAGSGPDPVQWVGNTYNWPFAGELDASEDLWINAESYPIGAGESGIVVYSADGGATWNAVDLFVGAPNGNNDWWHANLGSFPAGTPIQYAVAIVDGGGNYYWDNQNGQNYHVTVNAGQPVYWIGNSYHWPFDGDIDPEDDLWVNIESYPVGAATSAKVIYSTDGATWQSIDLELGGPHGNNDWWHISLGEFPSGTHLQYAILVQDGAGADHWDSNGGGDYHIDVN